MVLELRNKKNIDEYFRKMSIRIEKAIIYRLEALVAELQNHAKESAGYQDQTANLKSSIGGVVLKDGKPISYKGFEGAGEAGANTGMAFLNELISSAEKGYVIILVAGMEYASYVENYHDLNVLKKSELKMNKELKTIMDGLKAKISML